MLDVRWKSLSTLSKPLATFWLKPSLQIDRDTGSKCLIHGIKHHEDSQLQKLKQPYRWSWDAHIDGLVQNCGISIANALEILQPCTKPSIWYFLYFGLIVVLNFCRYITGFSDLGPWGSSWIAFRPQEDCIPTTSIGFFAKRTVKRLEFQRCIVDETLSVP